MRKVIGVFALAMCFSLCACMHPTRTAEPAPAPAPEPQIRDVVAYPAMEGDKWGFTDQEGNWIIEPKYDKVEAFSGDIICVYTEERKGYINTQGQPVFGENARFVVGIPCDGLTRIKKGGAYGYIDFEGNIVIDCNLYDALDFFEGLAAVRTKENSGYGYMDRQGNIVIPEEYISVGSFCEGLSPVCKEPGKNGYIDKDGKVVIPLEFEDAADFFGGLAAVKKDGKWGYLDTTGKMIIAPRFDDARGFSEGLAAVKENDKWGYLDTTGKMVIAPQFDDARGFSEGRALVSDYSGFSRGYIDITGEMVIKNEFYGNGEMSDFHGGKARVSGYNPRVDDEGNKYHTCGYIDLDGNWIYRWEEKVLNK